jgi:hypothetical protein
MIEITLNRYDCGWATKIGSQRRYESLMSNYQDVKRLSNGTMKDKLWYDVNGAGGELAACRALNVDWSASVNTPNDPDILLNDKKIDVKTSIANKRLLIPDLPKTHKTKDWYFLHVTGEMPTYHVWGAILVSDGMNIGSYEDPNGWGYAWFVDPENLTKQFNRS